VPEAIIDIVGRRPETVTLLILLVLAMCCLVFSMVKGSHAKGRAGGSSNRVGGLVLGARGYHCVEVLSPAA